MKKNLRTAIGLAACLFFSNSAFALKNLYVQFDHPEGWSCELAQGVWICQSTKEPERQEAVVLSIATMATEWDTLDNYENYLKQPKTITDDQGNAVTSKVTYARKRNINGHTWVDALHFNSELPGFWARYVATTHNKLAILITYIVSEEYYKQLAPQFERMVSSLRPNAEFNLSVATTQADGAPGTSERLGPNQKQLLIQRLRGRAGSGGNAALAGSTEAPKGTDDKTMLIAALGGVVVLFLFFRIRRKRKLKAQAGARREPGTPDPKAKKSA